MYQMEVETRFAVGQNIDVLDSVNRWCNAEIIKIAGPEMYIYYTGWSSKYNEWLPIDSDRVLTQWEPGKNVQIYNRLDVKHPLPRQWLEARVIQISEEDPDRVKVHFNNFHSKYDIWVNLNNHQQVTTIGTYSKAAGSGKRRRKEAFKISEDVLSKLRNLHEDFKESLKKRKLVIKAVGGDGNCLFRTISDQLYGTEEHHVQIREIVMDYILEEKAFFQNYVLDDLEDYVQRKRNLGSWGDDVELQAISEIYNRPIEVYVNDDKPIRTFHEDNDGSVFPIRVSYQGSCHYDSIKQQGFENEGLMQDKFPAWEKFFMLNLKTQEKRQDVYRNQFAHRTTIDEAVYDAMNNQVKENTNEVQNEMLKITETNSLLDEIEQAEIKQAQLNDEKNRIEEQLKRMEELEMEEIKRQSLREQENQLRTGLSIDEEFWIQGIRDQGFSDDEILLAIQIKGRNPDEVINYLYDNM